MSTIVSYPGVYIEENASQSLPVTSSPTAVPMIAVSGWTDSVRRYNSYLDFITHNNNPDWDDNIRPIKAYFDNGGGPCYIVNAGDFSKEVPKYDDITMIVAAGRDISSAVTALCQPGSGIFAILDGPNSALPSTGAADSFPSTPCAAAYYPWLSATDWTTHDIAPSAVVAGLYCKSDNTRGVWKAPANIALAPGYAPLYKVSDAQQGTYTQGKAINMIRELDGRGPLVWGARTLEDSDNWRYISVRRLFDSVERDIKTALQPMVFEPNSMPTWEKVRSAINNYLYSLWTQGALMGATAKDAYFVSIGEGTTMTADDIAQGKMIVEIGMAAVRPAEFIILQFTQDVAGA